MQLLGLLFQSHVITEQNHSISGMILDGKIIVLGEKPVSVPHCAPQIQHGHGWDETQ
jgi:hypothetical protein